MSFKNPMQMQLHNYGLSYPRRYPVGKQMGTHLYLHHSAAKPYLSKASHLFLKERLKACSDVIVKLDTSGPKPVPVSFTECPEWNTVAEPALGTVYKPDGSTAPPSDDPLVYHHKWLFVAPGYTGFDYTASQQRSLHWRKTLGRVSRAISSRIGRQSFWHQWLKDNNLPR